jgi:competence protein ComFC
MLVVPPFYLLVLSLYIDIDIKSRQNMISVVKNTLASVLTELICPHYCRICGKIGGILCECCKKYNMLEAGEVCLECGMRVDKDVDCTCGMDFQKGYLLGYKDTDLGKLVSGYKYEPTPAFSKVFAEMFDEVLPADFGSEVEIVPVPTVRKHIRERGFDHIGRIAKRLAEARGYKIFRGVERVVDSVQVGQTSKKRIQQAKKAYRIKKEARVEPEKVYLVIDDVWTTGATLKEVCRLLKNAGARKIIVAVITKNKRGLSLRRQRNC